MSNKFQ